MRKQILTVLGILLFTTSPVMADDANLLGDWGGARSFLDSRGVTLEAVVIMDLMHNNRGGIVQDGAILGNFDLTLNIDTETAGLWQNGTFFLYALGNFKEDKFLTEIVGDFQTSSNIEADSAFKLYEAWYEHSFAGDRVSFLAGLHDYNSEFDVLETAGLFLNSSFGISPDISQVGPSIFPLTALAGRLKINPNDNLYLMAAVYDGVPGDPDHPTRAAVKFEDGDGIFAALEAGITDSEPGSPDYYKLAVGGWRHTTEIEDFDGEVTDENKGVYLIAEKTMFAENDDGQGLTGFIQVGLADDDLNQIDLYWGAGVNYVGLIPGRDQDVFGLALAVARNGSPFVAFAEAATGGEVERTETSIELTYRAEILPWLTVQPDVQYILNPGMDPSLHNALVAGVRVEVLF